MSGWSCAGARVRGSIVNLTTSRSEVEARTSIVRSSAPNRPSVGPTVLAHANTPTETHRPAPRPGADAGGRPFRVLTVVDQWSRQSPVLEAASSMSGRTVRNALDRALSGGRLASRWQSVCGQARVCLSQILR